MRARFLLVGGAVLVAVMAVWMLGAPALRRAPRADGVHDVRAQRASQHAADEVRAFTTAASLAVEQEQRDLLARVDPAVAKARALLDAGDARAAIAAIQPLRVRLGALLEPALVRDPAPARAALARLDAVFDDAQRRLFAAAAEPVEPRAN